MFADSVRFDSNFHIPKALELSRQGKTVDQIARDFGVNATIMCPSGDWSMCHPEWKAVYPIIRQNCKASILDRMAQMMTDGEATSVNLGATKWLASVICGLSEKTEQRVEIEGNVHTSKSPLVLSFRDAKLRE